MTTKKKTVNVSEDQEVKRTMYKVVNGSYTEKNKCIIEYIKIHDIIKSSFIFVVGKEYFINCGEFDKEAGATKRIEQLKAKGIKSEIQQY